jgi:hypothetical protein
LPRLAPSWVSRLTVAATLPRDLPAVAIRCSTRASMRARRSGRSCG